MSPTAPTPTLHDRKMTSRPVRSAWPVRAVSMAPHGIHGRDRERGVVVPAVDVVDPAGLADPHEDAVERRGGRVELVEPGGVDRPQVGAGGVERADVLGQVLLERGGQGEHVGAQHDLHAELLGAVPERGEGVPHRQRPGDVLVALGVDRPVGGVLQGDELDEAGERDGGVAVGEAVPQEGVEVGVGLREGGLVDVRRARQDHVGERLRRVRVVRAARPTRAGSGVTPTAPRSTIRNGSLELTSSPSRSVTARPLRTDAARS